MHMISPENFRKSNKFVEFFYSKMFFSKVCIKTLFAFFILGDEHFYWNNEVAKQILLAKKVGQNWEFKLKRK